MRSCSILSLAVALIVFASPLRADDQALCRAVVDKAVQALGGKEKLAKLDGLTLKGKGKINPNEMQVTFTDDWTVKGADRFRVDMVATINDGNITASFGFNGEKGWVKASNATATNELPKDVTAAIQDGFRAARAVQTLALLQDKGCELSPLGESKIDDREAIGIRVIQKGKRDLSVFFDKKTSLPIKSEVTLAEPMGGQDILYEFFFADYKDFDGVKHFTKFSFKRDGKMFYESELSDIKAQDRVDDDTFNKP